MCVCVVYKHEPGQTLPEPYVSSRILSFSGLQLIEFHDGRVAQPYRIVSSRHTLHSLEQFFQVPLHRFLTVSSLPQVFSIDARFFRILFWCSARVPPVCFKLSVLVFEALTKLVASNQLELRKQSN